MSQFVIGYDPASNASNPSVLTITHKGEATEGTLVATYHGRPSGNRRLKRDIRRIAKYFGASLRKLPKNWFK